MWRIAHGRCWFEILYPFCATMTQCLLNLENIRHAGDLLARTAFLMMSSTQRLTIRRKSNTGKNESFLKLHIFVRDLFFCTRPQVVLKTTGPGKHVYLQKYDIHNYIRNGHCTSSNESFEAAFTQMTLDDSTNYICKQELIGVFVSIR